MGLVLGSTKAFAGSSLSFKTAFFVGYYLHRESKVEVNSRRL